MPKNIFQDMVPVNHTKRPKVEEAPKRARPLPIERVEKTRVIEREDYEPKKGHRAIWGVAVFAVVFFLFALSYFFAKAEVAIDPKIQDTDINQTLSANLKSADGDLSFDLIVISGEEKETVIASEEKQATATAHGTVVLYNNFSTVPQKLDINTRLEGSNGKIYKTARAITVPGMTGTTPGSVEVVVNGSEAGVGYNSDPLDFKVFGFKGTPKYEKFYGRSKGALTGGFKGLSHVVSAADKETAVKSLTEKLRVKLLQKATDQIPTGFILFKDAIYLDIEDGKNIDLLSSTTELPITLKGTLYGAILEEGELSKEISTSLVDKNEEVYVSNLKDLVFKLAGPTESLKDAKTINFSLSGSAKIVWKVNTVKLLGDLLGKSKKDFNQILLQYKNIEGAHLSLSPVWNRTIPDKADDVKININYPR